jgi:apolipoprotein N-acyltransferase
LALALLLGGLLTLAFPPFKFLPLAFLSLSGLLWLLFSAHSMRAAGLLGWAFGLGHFATSLYWIGYSFYVDADRFGALAVPSVLGLSAFLAMFPAVASAAARWLGGSREPALWLAFTALWSAGEWIRGHVLSGFPWNLTGYVWTVTDAPLQAAAAVGIYGLSFLTVAMASLPALALRRGIAAKHRWAALGAAALSIVALWIAGDVRLALAQADESVEHVSLRLVQPNVPQHLKWQPDQRETILERLLRLSGKAATREPALVLWPETAVPGLIMDDEDLRRRIAKALPPGAVLVTGTVRREDVSSLRSRVFNSVVAMAGSGEIIGLYDKVRLVPFGEYVPLQDVLPFVKMTAGPIDFSPGEEATTLAVPGAPPLQPLICYESIFPGNRPPPEDRPAWLLNLTNDAWFGDSAGPYQHFEMARVRAIESGLPLIRVANTGISAVVDAYGRVRARLPLNTEGTLDAELPKVIPDETFFVKAGNVPFFAMIGTALLLAFAKRCPRSLPATSASEIRQYSSDNRRTRE